MLVRLHRPADLPAFLIAPKPFGATVVDIVSTNPARVMLRTAPLAAGTSTGLAGALAALPSVQYAAAEQFLPMELRSAHVPNDPLFEDQWHLENRGQGGATPGADIDATTAWGYTRGSPDVVIAVLDDGVEIDHPDLAANIAGPGADFTVDPPAPLAIPRDISDRHGTSVAGVAAARGDNALGVSGVCPRCRVLPIRVYGSSNLGTAAAFRYAIEQGADIITNSWGYARAADSAADAAVRDAIDEAAERGRAGRGALIVFGVTNDPVDNCGPARADIASLESVMAVGVADHDDRLGGSGYGTCLDVVAPAKPERRSTVGVVTTDRVGIAGYTDHDYHTTFGGTSAAAPIVAGVAGLLLSLNPELTRTDLQRILEHTAEKIDPARAGYDARGFSTRAGYGRVNAARALVPTVKIGASPAVVEVGEPFSVTVTASAPFGLSSVGWRGIGTGRPDLDAEHRRAVASAAVATAVWTDLAIDRPGRYTLRADALDARHAAPLPGYPHRATEPATIEIEVREHAHARSR